MNGEDKAKVLIRIIGKEKLKELIRKGKYRVILME